MFSTQWMSGNRFQFVSNHRNPLMDAKSTVLSLVHRRHSVISLESNHSINCTFTAWRLRHGGRPCEFHRIGLDTVIITSTEFHTWTLNHHNKWFARAVSPKPRQNFERSLSARTVIWECLWTTLWCGEHVTGFIIIRSVDALLANGRPKTDDIYRRWRSGAKWIPICRIFSVFRSAGIRWLAVQPLINFPHARMKCRQAFWWSLFVCFSFRSIFDDGPPNNNNTNCDKQM